MGTRSVVGIAQGDTWKGRYVHWDGYPSGVGVEVLKIGQRLGAEEAIRVLTEEHAYWSSLDADQQPEELGPGYDDGRFEIVPGLGQAGTAKQADLSEWVTPDADWGTEWAYILTEHGVTVLEATTRDGGHSVGAFGFNPGAAWTYRDTIAWDDPDAEAKMESLG